MPERGRDGAVDGTGVAGPGRLLGRLELLERAHARLQARVAQLQRERDRLARLVEAGGDAAWEWDLVTGALWFSDGWFALLGYLPGELPVSHETWEERIHPDDAGALVAARDEQARGGMEHFRGRYRLRVRDGSWRWMQTHGRVVEHDVHGRPLRLAGSLTDVHEQVMLEREREVIARITRAVAEERGLPDLAALVAGQLRELIGCEACAVTRAERDGDWSALLAYSSDAGNPVPATRARAVREPLDRGLTVPMAEVVPGPFRTEIEFADGGIAEVSWDEAARAALMVDGRLWGAVTALGRPAGRHADMLARVGEVLALAISAGRAHEELARQAMTDALTGLANRRAFHERLDQEVARARRGGGALSLGLIDLDHFKAVNDLHGHPAGDAALVEVASRIASGARAPDLLARVGGEEFSWVMPDTGAGEARAAAERARALVGARPVPLVGAVSVSVGVATLRDGEDAGDLHRRADAALYRAKRAGRDRVESDDA